MPSNKRFKFDSKNCHAFCGAKIKANFFRDLILLLDKLGVEGVCLYSRYIG